MSAHSPAQSFSRRFASAESTGRTQPFTASPPVVRTRPFTEFRAFAADARCGCRTSSILARRAAQLPGRGPGAGEAHSAPAAPAPAAEPADPFSARYGRPLPQGMRGDAAGMSWAEFTAAYSPTDGPLRLRSVTQRRNHPASKTISATLQIRGETRTLRASGTGIISAMTAIVYEAGFPVEINSFHQQRAGAQTATFLECSRGYHRRWAMGTGATSAESIVSAFIAAANVLSMQPHTGTVVGAA